MNARQWTALGVVLALLAATAAFLTRVAAGHRLGQPGLRIVAEPTRITDGRVAQTNSVYLPPDLPGYFSKGVDVSPLEVSWLPKDTLFGRRYYHAKDGTYSNLVSVVRMGTDRTSIHKPQYCLESQGWHIDKSETAMVPIQRPYPYDLRVMKLTTSRQIQVATGQVAVRRGLYVYWFVADRLLTPHHGERMWWMARDLIRTGLLQRWAYVSYFTEFWPGQEQAAFEHLKRFVAESVPEFQLAAGPAGLAGSTAAVISGKPGREKN